MTIAVRIQTTIHVAATRRVSIFKVLNRCAYN
jgi:hypothetical protein